MFKKRSKKALSQVDWAMSLAIFLMYLAWFFIFVKPMLYPSTNMGVLLDILDDGIEREIFQDISRLKVFVPHTDNAYEPVIIPFDKDWQKSKIAHSADYFVIDGERMFFLANTSKSTVFQMYYPHKAVEMTLPRIAIADDQQARAGTFTAYFEDYLLDKVSFDGEVRLSGFNMKIDDTVLDGDGDMYNMSLLAKYVKQGDSINLTSYFFAENSRLYNYIKVTDHRNHSATIDFAAYNYTYFYINQLNNGELRYSIAQSCKYYTTDFLDLYDSNSGLLITFDRAISFRLCTNETSPSVRLEFPVSPGDEYNFNIFLHPGGADSVKDYPLNPVVGVTETLKTVSSEKARLLRNRNYAYLKQVFRYPDARDFNITISSDSLDASYGVEQPDLEDVYVRRVEGVMLEKDYSQGRALLTLSVW
jgi:hypothetical protein